MKQKEENCNKERKMLYHKIQKEMEIIVKQTIEIHKIQDKKIHKFQKR